MSFKCPKCSSKTKVLDTRDDKRRRSCPDCDYEFWTSELLSTSLSVYRSELNKTELNKTELNKTERDKTERDKINTYDRIRYRKIKNNFLFKTKKSLKNMRFRLSVKIRSCDNLTIKKEYLESKLSNGQIEVFIKKVSSNVFATHDCIYDAVNKEWLFKKV